MSVNNHISELERKHKKLEQELESLQQKPGGTADDEILEKKRHKLKIKDEIKRLAS